MNNFTQDGLAQWLLTREWGSTEPSAGGRPIALPGTSQAERGEGPVGRLVRSIVEAEVIPRLVQAQRAVVDAAPPPVECIPGTSRNYVSEFATLVLTHDASVASSFVRALRAQGMTLDSVYLNLLAPTARLLGELWEADVCDFTDVTVGLGRLQQVLRELSSQFREEAASTDGGRRALLGPVAGEQHTFGLFMVAEFFRRAGWDVYIGPLASSDDMLGLVRGKWFDVVGLSTACESKLDAVAAEIRAIRRVSRNRAISVMVGGPIFTANPEYAALVGADGSSPDGRLAPQLAADLVSSQQRP